MSRHILDDKASTARPLKRRKVELDFGSSPPRSSPLKHVQTSNQIEVFEDAPTSPIATDDDTLSDLLEQLQPFPEPIRKIWTGGTARRVLNRSFGGYDVLSRGRRGVDHCADWRSETANFVSTPNDVHSFRPGTAIPFCTASCRTNSLIAIGDEEGSVRLADSGRGADFKVPHVSFRIHRNAIMDVAFSSDDYTLATASGDQTARMIDMHTQQTMCVLTGHSSSVKQVRFQPNDDNMVTTSSRDGTVQIWDLRCAERGSVQSLGLRMRRQITQDGDLEPSVRYARNTIRVGGAHRSSKGSGTKSPSTQNSEDSSVSITAIEHIPNGREHLLLTASELNASVKLWDLRNASRRDPAPVSCTPVPQLHRRTRNYGISSLALSGDGARLYTLCKDATIYAYSTNHLILGNAPEMSASPARRRALKVPKMSCGPLYAFKHPLLVTSTFYVKLALRPARNDRSELLAVGSGTGSPILFPTDERHMPHQYPQASNRNVLDDEEDELSVSPSTKREASTYLPVHERGTPLIRGHAKEVTSLSWSHDGELVTISDDWNARCWRENPEKAREMRRCGEGGGQRWAHGWAEVEGEWDEDDC